MAYRTEGELNFKAVQIADLIAETDISQRQRLYELIALKLKLRSQHHQAMLFETIAKVA